MPAKVEESTTTQDKESMKILSAYDPMQPADTSARDFEKAKKAGLMFDPLPQTHEAALTQLFKSFAACSKQHITDLFLASLSGNHLEWRSGLPVYAIMQTFPKHPFKAAGPQLKDQCAVCCSSPKEKVDLSFINQIRFFYSGLVMCDVYEYAFLLKQHTSAPAVKPVPQDFTIFSKILDLFINAETKDTPTKMIKKLKIPGFKSTEEQRRLLIDTLGYCSILETQTHKGFLTQYTNLGVTPRKERNSDWHYPVDWWEGKDGVNKKAFKFWFGNYPELKKYTV